MKTESGKNRETPIPCPKCGGTGELRHQAELVELLEKASETIKTLSIIGTLEQDEPFFFLTETKVSYPRSGTEASKDFFNTLSQINSFYSFLLELVSKSDAASALANEMLTLPDGGKLRYKGYKLAESPGSEANKYLENNRQFILEVICVRLVENYLNYLSSLIYEIFIQRPETMKSSEQVDIESVLSHDSLDSLVRSLADKKISDLSYSSFKDISKYFFKKFKLNVCKDKHLDEMSLAVEVRNISVHNRCRIDEKFIKHTSYDSKANGKKLEIGGQYIKDIALVMFDSVKSLDSNARKKLNLKSKRFAINPVPGDQ